MDQYPLIVLSISRDAPPLRTLADDLIAAGQPVSLSIGVDGAASEAQLAAADWDAAFVRWDQPEVHEAWLIERAVLPEDEDAVKVVDALTAVLNQAPESAGKLIVRDQLERVRTLYLWTILPAMVDGEDHPAWSSLDIALRALADATEGLIYAAAEGYFDADGEPLLETTPLTGS